MNENCYKIFDTKLIKIHQDYAEPACDKFKTYGDLYEDFISSLRHAFSVYAYEPPIMEDSTRNLYKITLCNKNTVGEVYDEFNLLFLMCLPGTREIFINKVKPGLITIRHDMADDVSPEIAELMSQYRDSSTNYLNPKKFYNWGESILSSKMFDTDNVLLGEKGSYFTEIKESTSNCVISVSEIETNYNFEINVTFGLDIGIWPFEDENKDMKWLAVANKMVMDKLYWNYSFPSRELSLLNANIHMRIALRLVRRIRRNNSLSFLTTYHIDTLFLNALNVKPSVFWTKSVGVAFVEMLQNLYDALRKKNLPFFWDSRYELFGVLTQDQLDSGKEKLLKILEKIYTLREEKTPDAISELILTREEILVDDNGSHTSSIESELYFRTECCGCEYAND